MLVIISDLHLGDGTTAASIPASAFHLFARRLQETANLASFTEGGRFKSIKELDVVLMGDILDPLHSTAWLDSMPGDEGYIRPWSDPETPNFARKLEEVTEAILQENAEAMQVLRNLASGERIHLAPDARSQQWTPLPVRFHYMVGNHDWYYRLDGPAFNRIRSRIIERMGLSNDNSPFPHEASESEVLADLFEKYRVLGRHGDRFDKFNFDPEKGRNSATLGDAFTMEVCNRFPVEVQKSYGEEVPSGIVDGLRRITNIRPTLAVPLWISAQIRDHAVDPAMEGNLKKIWDQLADEFLQLEFVRQSDRSFQFDVVDVMQLIVKLSKRVSYSTVNDVMMFVHNRLWESDRSFSHHALKEQAFRNKRARFIVYGHTHHPEMAPLNHDSNTPLAESQVYFNTGSWHSYFDLTIQNPREQKFVQYETLTYLAFFLPHEYGTRQYEVWRGAFA